MLHTDNNVKLKVVTAVQMKREIIDILHFGKFEIRYLRTTVVMHGWSLVACVHASFCRKLINYTRYTSHLRLINIRTT